jgi:cell division septum initiation protein DivIVA
MGLFSFFNRKNGSDYSASESLQDIPESVFIEKDKNAQDSTTESNGSSSPDYGIRLLFQFLEKNYESSGYDDALVNPDTTNMEHNIAGLKNDLERTLTKVKIFYTDFIREIEVHLSSRRRSGMVDIVEELTAKKETAESHIKKVIEIEQQALNNAGVGHGIILSYTKGFRNGLAAISHHSILRINF